MRQQEAAAAIGAHPGALENCEHGRCTPSVRFYPALISFLGFNPLPQPKTLGNAVQRERTSRGWSREHLARAAGIDEATVARLEDDTPRMAKGPMLRIMRALDLSLPNQNLGTLISRALSSARRGS
jgi:DNA-binding XRE family transcriptional regulator